MTEYIDRLPEDVADRKVFWAGSILLKQAMEVGRAALRYDDLDIEVELLRMKSAQSKSKSKERTDGK